MNVPDLRSWWEVPSIAHFCSLFRSAFDLTDFDIEDLEEGFVQAQTEDGSAFLLDLLCRLLNGCYGRKDVTIANFDLYVKDIIKYKWDTTDNPIKEKSEFKTLSLREKVELIYAICEYRLDTEDVIEQIKGFEGDSMRVEPLGKDKNGALYWYFYGTRLYVEDPEPKKELSKEEKRAKDRQRRIEAKKKKQEEKRQKKEEKKKLKALRRVERKKKLEDAAKNQKKIEESNTRRSSRLRTRKIEVPESSSSDSSSSSEEEEETEESSEEEVEKEEKVEQKTGKGRSRKPPAKTPTKKETANQKTGSTKKETPAKQPTRSRSRSQAADRTPQKTPDKTPQIDTSTRRSSRLRKKPEPPPLPSPYNSETEEENDYDIDSGHESGGSLRSETSKASTSKRSAQPVRLSSRRPTVNVHLKRDLSQTEDDVEDEKNGESCTAEDGKQDSKVNTGDEDKAVKKDNAKDESKGDNKVCSEDEGKGDKNRKCQNESTEKKEDRIEDGSGEGKVVGKSEIPKSEESAESVEITDGNTIGNQKECAGVNQEELKDNQTTENSNKPEELENTNEICETQDSEKDLDEVSKTQNSEMVTDETVNKDTKENSSEESLSVKTENAAKVELEKEKMEVDSDATVNEECSKDSTDMKNEKQDIKLETEDEELSNDTSNANFKRVLRKRNNEEDKNESKNSEHSDDKESTSEEQTEPRVFTLSEPAVAPLPSKSSTRWHLVCETLDDWINLAEWFKESEVRCEKALSKVIREDFLPVLPEILEAREKEKQKRLLQEQELRRSNRITMKMREKIEQEKILAEALAEEEKARIRAEEEKRLKEEQLRLEDENRQREERRKAREDRAMRLSMREERSRLLAEGKEIPQEMIYTGTSKYKDEGDDSDDSKCDLKEEEDFQALVKVISAMKYHKDCWPFLEPVTDEQAPGYSDVIKRPMDLSKIEEKVEKREYRSTQHFLSDFRLMFNNCKRFNGQDSEFSDCARSMENMLKKYMKRFVSDEPTDKYYEDKPFVLPGGRGARPIEKRYRPQRAASSRALQTVHKALNSDEEESDTDDERDLVPVRKKPKEGASESVFKTQSHHNLLLQEMIELKRQREKKLAASALQNHGVITRGPERIRVPNPQGGVMIIPKSEMSATGVLRMAATREIKRKVAPQLPNLVPLRHGKQLVVHNSATETVLKADLSRKDPGLSILDQTTPGSNQPKTIRIVASNGNGQPSVKQTAESVKVSSDGYLIISGKNSGIKVTENTKIVIQPPGANQQSAEDSGQPQAVGKEIVIKKVPAPSSLKQVPGLSLSGMAKTPGNTVPGTASASATGPSPSQVPSQVTASASPGSQMPIQQQVSLQRLLRQTAINPELNQHQAALQGFVNQMGEKGQLSADMKKKLDIAQRILLLNQQKRKVLEQQKNSQPQQPQNGPASGVHPPKMIKLDLGAGADNTSAIEDRLRDPNVNVDSQLGSVSQNVISNVNIASDILDTYYSVLNDAKSKANTSAKQNTSSVSITMPQNVQPVTQNVGLSQSVAANTTGISQSVAANTTGISQNVAANTAGISQSVNANTAGISQSVVANTTGISQSVAANTTGISQSVSANTTGISQSVVANTTGISQSVVANTSQSVVVNTSQSVATTPTVSQLPVSVQGVVMQQAPSTVTAVPENTKPVPVQGNMSEVTRQIYNLINKSGSGGLVTALAKAQLMKQNTPTIVKQVNTPTVVKQVINEQTGSPVIQVSTVPSQNVSVSNLNSQSGLNIRTTNFVSQSGSNILMTEPVTMLTSNSSIADLLRPTNVKPETVRSEVSPIEALFAKNPHDITESDSVSKPCAQPTLIQALTSVTPVTMNSTLQKISPEKNERQNLFDTFETGNSNVVSSTVVVGDPCVSGQSDCSDISKEIKLKLRADGVSLPSSSTLNFGSPLKTSSVLEALKCKLHTVKPQSNENLSSVENVQSTCICCELATCSSPASSDLLWELHHQCCMCINPPNERLPSDTNPACNSSVPGYKSSVEMLNHSVDLPNTAVYSPKCSLASPCSVQSENILQKFGSEETKISEMPDNYIEAGEILTGEILTAIPLEQFLQTANNGETEICETDSVFDSTSNKTRSIMVKESGIEVTIHNENTSDDCIKGIKNIESNDQNDVKKSSTEKAEDNPNEGDGDKLFVEAHLSENLIEYNTVEMGMKEKFLESRGGFNESDTENTEPIMQEKGTENEELARFEFVDTDGASNYSDKDRKKDFLDEHYDENKEMCLDCDETTVEFIVKKVCGGLELLEVLNENQESVENLTLIPKVPSPINVRNEAISPNENDNSGNIPEEKESCKKPLAKKKGCKGKYSEEVLQKFRIVFRPLKITSDPLNIYSHISDENYRSETFQSAGNNPKKTSKRNDLHPVLLKDHLSKIVGKKITEDESVEISKNNKRVKRKILRLTSEPVKTFKISGPNSKFSAFCPERTFVDNDEQCKMMHRNTSSLEESAALEAESLEHHKLLADSQSLQKSSGETSLMDPLQSLLIERMENCLNKETLKEDILVPVSRPVKTCKTSGMKSDLSSENNSLALPTADMRTGSKKFCLDGTGEAYSQCKMADEQRNDFNEDGTFIARTENQDILLTAFQELKSCLSVATGVSDDDVQENTPALPTEPVKMNKMLGAHVKSSTENWNHMLRTVDKATYNDAFYFGWKPVDNIPSQRKVFNKNRKKWNENDRNLVEAVKMEKQDNVPITCPNLKIIRAEEDFIEPCQTHLLESDIGIVSTKGLDICSEETIKKTVTEVGSAEMSQSIETEQRNISVPPSEFENLYKIPEAKPNSSTDNLNEDLRKKEIVAVDKALNSVNVHRCKKIVRKKRKLLKEDNTSMAKTEKQNTQLTACQNSAEVNSLRPPEIPIVKSYIGNKCAEEKDLHSILLDGPSFKTNINKITVVESSENGKNNEKVKLVRLSSEPVRMYEISGVKSRSFAENLCQGLQTIDITPSSGTCCSDRKNNEKTTKCKNMKRKNVTVKNRQSFIKNDTSVTNIRKQDILLAACQALKNISGEEDLLEPPESPFFESDIGIESEIPLSDFDINQIFNEDFFSTELYSPIYPSNFLNGDGSNIDSELEKIETDVFELQDRYPTSVDAIGSLLPEVQITLPTASVNLQHSAVNSSLSTNASETHDVMSIRSNSYSETTIPSVVPNAMSVANVNAVSPMPAMQTSVNVFQNTLPLGVSPELSKGNFFVQQPAAVQVPQNIMQVDGLQGLLPTVLQKESVNVPQVTAMQSSLPQVQVPPSLLEALQQVAGGVAVNQSSQNVLMHQLKSLVSNRQSNQQLGMQSTNVVNSIQQINQSNTMTPVYQQAYTEPSILQSSLQKVQIQNIPQLSELNISNVESTQSDTVRQMAMEVDSGNPSIDINSTYSAGSVGISGTNMNSEAVTVGNHVYRVADTSVNFGVSNNLSTVYQMGAVIGGNDPQSNVQSSFYVTQTDGEAMDSSQNANTSMTGETQNQYFQNQ